MNAHLKKYFKKSHFLSQKLIFHCLKTNLSKKSRFFFYFHSHGRLELLAHVLFGMPRGKTGYLHVG